MKMLKLNRKAEVVLQAQLGLEVTPPPSRKGTKQEVICMTLPRKGTLAHPPLTKINGLNPGKMSMH